MGRVITKFLVVIGLILADCLAWGGGDDLMPMRGTRPEGGQGINMFSPEVSGARARKGAAVGQAAAATAETAGAVRLLKWQDNCATVKISVSGTSFDLEPSGSYNTVPRYSGREGATGEGFLEALFGEQTGAVATAVLGEENAAP